MLISQVTSMQGMNQSNPENIPDLSLIASSTQDEHEKESLIQTIQSLSLELQQTLVIDNLLHIFCEKVAALIPCDSVAYENKMKDICWQSGETSQHQCQYQLTLNGESLGAVSCTRSHPFSAHDLQIIEWLVAILIYPVRNALLYLDALSSALKDGLTGAGNRMAYDEAISREMDKAQRNNQKMALLIVDIDHFKNFNDHYGHATGDKVLAAVCKDMQKTLRRSDLLFRYGGEEFAVILSPSDSHLAEQIAERLRQSVANLKLGQGKKKLSITISLGAAEIKQKDTPKKIFERADKALYRAKNNGRNQVGIAA